MSQEEILAHVSATLDAHVKRTEEWHEESERRYLTTQAKMIDLSERCANFGHRIASLELEDEKTNPRIVALMSDSAERKAQADLIRFFIVGGVPFVVVILAGLIWLIQRVK